jgi:NADH-quinone oxidoreductase subunit N
MYSTASAMLFYRDFFVLAPEIVLAVWGLIVVLADAGWLRKKPMTQRRLACGWLTLAGVFLALVTALLPILVRTGFFSNLGMDQLQTALNLPRIDYDADPDPAVLFGTVAADLLTDWMNLLFVILLGLVVGMSMSWTFTEDWGEYFALMLWSTVGMMLLTAAEELLTLFLTLETMTICLYLCTAFEKDRRRSAEGGLKYFVYGSVSSALFLFGLSLIYGLTGTTQLHAIRQALEPAAQQTVGLANNVAGATAVLLIMVGFGFKIAAVPFHQWAPDAYEGAPAPVTAWVATGSKVASFVALMKVLLHGLGPWASGSANVMSPGWIGVIVALSAASMTFGNFAALAQRNLKRMLAYSSIAHAGYMLVGVAAAGLSARHEESAGSVLYYLVVYAFSNLGAFALAAWLVRDLKTDDIEDLNGLGLQYPGLATCILLLMLSLIGMPPLAGFFGKLYMFMEALNERNQAHLTLVWLVGLGLLNSVVSAYYYVRVLKAMFLRGPGKRVVAAPSMGISLPIVLGTVVVVGFGVFPGPLTDTMKSAAIPMLLDSGMVSNEGMSRALEYRARMRPAAFRSASEPAPPAPVPQVPSGRGRGEAAPKVQPRTIRKGSDAAKKPAATTKPGAKKSAPPAPGR